MVYPKLLIAGTITNIKNWSTLKFSKLSGSLHGLSVVQSSIMQLRESDGSSLLIPYRGCECLWIEQTDRRTGGRQKQQYVIRNLPERLKRSMQQVNQQAVRREISSHFGCFEMKGLSKVSFFIGRLLKLITFPVIKNRPNLNREKFGKLILIYLFIIIYLFIY